MTETQAAPSGGQPPLAAIGQAEALLSKLLARVLAELGTSRQDYLALQRLAALGGSALREDYLTDLSGWLDIDLWAAGELADGLAGSGLLAHDGPIVRFAPAGAQLRERIARSASVATRPLVAPIDPADLEVTIRTLRELTARARTVLRAEAGAVA